MYELEQNALLQETLLNEQHELLNKVWGGEYYHNGVPILQELGRVTLELSRLHIWKNDCSE